MLEMKRIKKPQPEVCTEQRGSLKTKISPGKGPEGPLKRWGLGLKTVNLLKNALRLAKPSHLLPYLKNFRIVHDYHKAYPRGFCLDDLCIDTEEVPETLPGQTVYQVTSPPLLPCPFPHLLLLIISSHISMDQASPSIWQRFQEKIWTNIDR